MEQWLRIRLPMQGTRVQALVQEDPTCCGATKPVCHNYWACALETTHHNYWARVLQLLKPTRLEPVLRNEKPPQWEVCAPQGRVAPARHNSRKLAHSNEDPTQPKIKKQNKTKMMLLISWWILWTFKFNPSLHVFKKCFFITEKYIFFTL